MTDQSTNLNTQDHFSDDNDQTIYNSIFKTYHKLLGANATTVIKVRVKLRHDNMIVQDPHG